LRRNITILKRKNRADLELEDIDNIFYLKEIIEKNMTKNQEVTYNIYRSTTDICKYCNDATNNEAIESPTKIKY
jgi:hypothetical protein